MSVRPATPAEVDGAADEAEIPVYVETGPYAGMTFIANRNDPTLKEALQNKTALVQPGAVLLPPPPLALTRITPNPALLNPGLTTLTIEGTGFSPSTQINIEGEGWTTTPVTFVSPTQITFQRDLKTNYVAGSLNVHVRNDQTLDLGTAPKIATRLEYPPLAVVVTGDTNPITPKLTLDFDGAQPAPRPIDAVPQTVKLSVAGGGDLAELGRSIYVLSSGAALEAKIGGATVALKMTFTDPTANWSQNYGPTWSTKAMWDAASAGGSFTIAKVGADYVMNFQGQPPPASWQDCTTEDELFYWARSVELANIGSWDNFSLKYDRVSGDGARLDPTITIAQAKAALATSSLLHYFDADNKAAPAQGDIAVTIVKDAAATATDRRAVITVTFPAGLKGWCIYQGKFEDQVGAAPDGCQAKPLDGNTQAIFNVTFSRDGGFQASVWVGQTYKNNAPSVTFP